MIMSNSVTKEVVTLQLGHYANFIGTHVWNIQESSFCYSHTGDGGASSEPKEFDSDVLYREGRTLLGDVTYTPRLIAVDLKGSLKTLRPDGVLYDLDSELDDITWGGDVTMHKASPPVKNQFLTDLDMSEQNSQQHRDRMDDDAVQDKESEEQATSSEQTVPSIRDKQYHLNDSVAVWSDYLYGHLHPKSLSVIRDYSHRSETEPFELYPQGKDLLRKQNVLEELEDKLHFFTEECDHLQGEMEVWRSKATCHHYVKDTLRKRNVLEELEDVTEECDHLQGFQILSNFDDGFSGMSAGLVELLDDEYHGKGILTWGVHPGVPSTEQTSKKDNYRIINAALAFDQLSRHSSLFTPVSLNSTLWRKRGPAFTSPYLTYDPCSDYHTSAILASCIDTATLPYRMTSDALTISELSEMLSVGGRKIGTLCSAYPFPLSESKPLATTLRDIKDTSFLRALAANIGHGVHTPYSQLVVCRGIPSKNIKGNVPQPQNPFEYGKRTDEMMKMLVASLYPKTVSSLLSVAQAAPTSTPYPHIFSPLVTPSGLIGYKPRTSTETVKSIPIVTSLQSSPASGHMLTKLITEAKKIDLRRHHGYFENNMEEDEYQEILDNLDTLSQTYRTGSSGLEVSDDDD